MTNDPPALPTNTNGKSEEDYAEQQRLNAESAVSDQEKQNKAEKLDSYMSQKIDVQLAPIIANLQEHGSKIDQLIQIIQQAQTTEQAAPPGQNPPQMQQPLGAGGIKDLKNVPPEIAEGLMNGLANIVSAFKGGSSAPKDDYFGDMSKKITMNMLQAGVDGIMQNVYQNYRATPPQTSTSPQPQFSGDHKVQ